MWIFPLGVYIKVAQEANLCGGRRAICLCTQAMAKMKAESKAVNYSRAMPQSAPIQKDKSNSPQFILSSIAANSSLNTLNFSNRDTLLGDIEGYYRAVEHVPIG